MIRNYIITAFRNIVRFKLHSAINIGGLALGVSIFTLIMIYVVSELSYNKYHANYAEIYQVSVNNGLKTTAHLGHSLQESFPEIKYMVRIDLRYGGGQKAYLTNMESEEAVEFEDIIYADTGFFNMFSVEPIAGDLSTALKDPYSLVLTESYARKLFGSVDAIDKIVGFVSADGRLRQDFTITAVIEDQPGNSSLKYTAIASFITLNDIKPGGIEADQDYYNWGYFTYLMLHDHIDIQYFENKARDEYIKFTCETYEIDPASEEAAEITMNIVPLAEVPFYGNNKRQFISLIILLGVLILVIALINFINLSLAKSSFKE